MKIRLLGMSIETGRGITLEEFFDYLGTLRGQQIPAKPYDRVLYTDYKPPYHRGLFVSVKDQKKFLTMRQQGGSFTITAKEVEEGTNLIDFNFFVVHGTTGRGLYQYYHHSCSLTSFGAFLHQRYKDLKDQRIKDYLAKHGDSGAEERRAKSLHKGGLVVEQMVRKEKLEELLGELDEIRTFGFDLAVVDVPDPVFTPLKEYIKKRHYRVAFAKGTTEAVRSGIVEVANKYNLTRGRIVGTDEDENERVLRLTNNADVFGEYEFDELAPAASFKIEQFATARLLVEMIKQAKANEAIFEAPAR